MAGTTATATFTVPEGTTEFQCTFHGGTAQQARPWVGVLEVSRPR